MASPSVQTLLFLPCNYTRQQTLPCKNFKAFVLSPSFHQFFGRFPLVSKLSFFCLLDGFPKCPKFERNYTRQQTLPCNYARQQTLPCNYTSQQTLYTRQCPNFFFLKVFPFSPSKLSALFRKASLTVQTFTIFFKASLSAQTLTTFFVSKL